MKRTQSCKQSAILPLLISIARTAPSRITCWKITTRADDLDEARKKDPKYEVFENNDMKVRIHGDTAVVTGRRHTKGIAGGKPFDSKFQFTDTFVKDAGRWRLLAGHVSKRGWGTRKSTGQNF
jgi:ketosteroid isomerase-like protein